MARIQRKNIFELKTYKFDGKEQKFSQDLWIKLFPPNDETVLDRFNVDLTEKSEFCQENLWRHGNLTFFGAQKTSKTASKSIIPGKRSQRNESHNVLRCHEYKPTCNKSSLWFSQEKSWKRDTASKITCTALVRNLWENCVKLTHFRGPKSQRSSWKVLVENYMKSMHF